MKNVLIVDDDASFLMSLSDGLKAYSSDFSVATVENGARAVAYLSANPADLVVTDLKMPVLDGFELLAHMGSHHPHLPVIVMTAFGTPDIEKRIDTLGALSYIEKPLDFKVLAGKINEGLAASSRGYINNMNLASFLQLVEMEKKTCTLVIKEGGKQGTLYFSKGVMLDAEIGDVSGVDAAYEIVCWKNAEIEINSVCKKKEKKINYTLHHIFMEGFFRKDEQEREAAGKGTDKAAAVKTTAAEKTAVADKAASAENAAPANKAAGTEKQPEQKKTGDAGGAASPDAAKNEKINSTPKENNNMAIQDKLKEMASIDGFGGVGLFTPTGEALAIHEAAGSKANLKMVGVLANNVLMNAQKASLEMGTGRGQLVHVEAEHAHIIVRCLNEGTDPLKSQPGKAHIHLVLFLTTDASIGLAKMKVNSMIQGCAEECRM